MISELAVDPNSVLYSGKYPPFVIAVGHRHRQAVEVLAELGADVNMVGTVFFFDIFCITDLPAIATLTQYGAGGFTALHMAADYGLVDMIRLVGEKLHANVELGRYIDKLILPTRFASCVWHI